MNKHLLPVLLPAAILVPVSAGAQEALPGFDLGFGQSTVAAIEPLVRLSY